MEVASELILVGLLVNVLWQCLYVVNAGCIGVDTCRIACERAVAVLVRSDAGCIGVDTCRIACERAVAVLVRSCRKRAVAGCTSELILVGLLVNVLWQCLYSS